MAGAPVEDLPGGLLERLLQAPANGAVTGAARSCLGGAWSAAVRDLASADPGTAPASLLAWRRLARHRALLGLPGGGALPLQHAAEHLTEVLTAPDTAGLAPQEAAECRLLGLLVAVRDVRASLPPLAPGSPYTDVLLEHGLDQLVAVWEDVRAVRPDVAGHLLLLDGDLRHRAGRLDAAAVAWQQAWAHFEAVGDQAGLACAALLAGDHQAAPFASPESWDCALEVPTGLDSGLRPEVEQREHRPPAAADVEAAARAYDSAQALYRAAGSARGLAVVAHRRAYLTLLSDGPGAAVAPFEEAAAQLSAAGARGDHVLARVHAALARLGDDRLPEDPATAQEITAWSRGDGGPGAGLGLALLATRLGRRWLGQAPERSAAAARVAAAVHRAAGAAELHAQALADQANASAATSDVAGAQLLLLAALDADDAPLALPATPLDTRRMRRALLWASVYNLASSVRDVPAMQRAAAQVKEVAEPLRAGLDELGPMEQMSAQFLLQLSESVGSDVVGLLYDAQQALRVGDDARAEAAFARAEAVAREAPAEDRDAFLAYVAAYRRDLPAAGVAYRRHLAARLGELSTEGAALPSGLERERRRSLHGQAFLFFVRIRDVPGAREHLERLRATAQPWWEGLGSAWEHLFALGRLEEVEGDLAAAQATFDRAIACAAEVREGLRRDDAKTAFSGDATVQDLYRAAARVAVVQREAALARGDAAEARQHAARATSYAEEARARALLDLLAVNERPDELAPALPAWRSAVAGRRVRQDRLRALLQAGGAPDALDAARTALDTADREVAALEGELRDQAPDFWSRASPQARTSTLEEIADALPEGTVALQYSVDAPDFVAWALTRQGMVRARHDLEERTLARQVSRLLHGYVTGAPVAQLESVERDLADLLLEPFADVLDASRRIVVVGSGPTLRLPFAALPWRSGRLGLRAPVTTVPSLSALRLLRQAPEQRRGPALVVGNPRDMAHVGPSGRVEQPSLPAAGVEARYVAGLLGADLLVDADATEDRVRELLPAAGLVHLATHGWLDEQAPLDSSVLLADGEALSAAEVVGLRLRAELVVLSACHSGQGPVVGGDDVLGLGRGLLAAGARSALLTLWSIDDVSGALLMGELYRRRSAGDDTAEALRGAAAWLQGLTREQADEAFGELARAVGVDTREGALVGRVRGVTRTVAARTPYAHPRHWAAYVLVGA